MQNYEGLQVLGCVDSDVELSNVAPTSEIWFPDEAPKLKEPEVTDPQGWLPQDEEEFFWQELTEEEISHRRCSFRNMLEMSHKKELCLIFLM